MFLVCHGETLHVLKFTRTGPETVVTTVCWWTCDIGKYLKLFLVLVSFCFFSCTQTVFLGSFAQCRYCGEQEVFVTTLTYWTVCHVSEKAFRCRALAVVLKTYCTSILCSSVPSHSLNMLSVKTLHLKNSISHFQTEYTFNWNSD